MRARVLLASLFVLLAAWAAGCGGPTTLAMYGHTIVYEGNHEHVSMTYDGRAIPVRYDPSLGAYVAADCDVGPGSTLDLLAEQVAASPNQCTPRTPEP
ncbi:MAG: hypothetical protein U0234_29830 [Sandaracinus sp.]